MEKKCSNCRHSGKGVSHPICGTCCMSTYGIYPQWKPSKEALENARKEIMEIMHDMAKRKFNLEVFEKYDPIKPEYLTVNFVISRDCEIEVVTTVAFDLVDVKITSESLGRIEEQIRDDLAKLNGGYYLENMDVASWYPSRMIKTNWENHDTMHKKSLNYLYGRKIFDNPYLVNIEQCMKNNNPDGFRPDVTILDELHEYCKKDVEVTKDVYEKFVRGRFNMMAKPEIKKVIFNNPATIVMWKDGSKTVVKAQNGEQFDPEKGLAMAISKKVLGNNRDYFDKFKKWLPKEKRTREPIGKVTNASVDDFGLKLRVAIEKAGKAINDCLKEGSNNE